MADELFNQADQDRDQRLDLNEFRQLLALSMGIRPRSTTSENEHASNTHASVSATNSAHEQGPYGNYGDATEVAEGHIDQRVPADGGATNSSYDQSLYASTSPTPVDASGSIAGERYLSSGVGVSAFAENTSAGFDLSAGREEMSSSPSFHASHSPQQEDRRNSNPQNLYIDPNPEIIRRPAQGGNVIYTQNIKLRFLQPPPIPPPGPLIIKEVRPPQPPPPPPLRIRQQAPPLPPLPPLILRERPPPVPAVIAEQTVVRNLPALPPPPRSVIIERLPALPAKPRDIIIERWLPYPASAKRKTIVQRAAGEKTYPKPRNIIIQYEPISARITRQFQRLGVTQEDPRAYVHRYGASLLDGQTLVQRARAAGVVEDISPPNGVAASSPSFKAEASSAHSGIELSANADRRGSSSGSGVGVEQNASGFQSSTFGSSSSFAQGSASASGYESRDATNGRQLDPAIAAFKAADLNRDGGLDEHEFRQFVNAQLQQ